MPPGRRRSSSPTTGCCAPRGRRRTTRPGPHGGVDAGAPALPPRAGRGQRLGLDHGLLRPVVRGDRALPPPRAAAPLARQRRCRAQGDHGSGARARRRRRGRALMVRHLERTSSLLAALRERQGGGRRLSSISARRASPAPSATCALGQGEQDAVAVVEHALLHVLGVDVRVADRHVARLAGARTISAIALTTSGCSYWRGKPSFLATGRPRRSVIAPMPGTSRQHLPRGCRCPPGARSSG